jgi:cyclic pyranopterin phosphate synthase
MGMVDIGSKRVVYREATASGTIHLRKETMEEIKKGAIKKGNPFQVAEIAGINAAKQTSLLIPHCHQIPLDDVAVTFHINHDSIGVSCTVKANAKTGVEMEALVGLLLALSTLLDMVKYLEKDEKGQYPYTTISGIRILEKRKAK